MLLVFLRNYRSRIRQLMGGVGNMSLDAKFAVQWRTFKQSVPSRRMVKLAVRFTEKKGDGEQTTLLFNVKNIKIVYITH